MLQDPARQESGQTKFEIFSSTQGILHVTEFYEIGAVAIKHGSCTVTLIRSRNTQSNATSVAVRFDYKDANNRKYFAILDADEIVSLDSALKYVWEHKPEMVRAAKTYTEVVYSSRGGFKAGLYISGSKEVGEYMVIGNQTVFFHSIEELRRIVDATLFKIEGFKSH